MADFSSSDQAPKLDRPSQLGLLGESRLPFELAALAITSPTLLSAPRGDGHRVVLCPGFGASGDSMWPLRSFLRRLGYHASDWGLGSNGGKVDAYVEALVSEVDHGRLGARSISLVGWSLGGVIARELARARPDAVRQVVTMGTPVIGGPKYTAVGDVFARQENIDLDEFEIEVHRRNLLGLKPPVTAIFSKSDGVVAWRATQDIYNPQTRHVEVVSSHAGLGFNTRVWREIAGALARSGEPAP